MSTAMMAANLDRHGGAGVPLWSRLSLLAQLLAATWIVYHFRIEGTPLFEVMAFAVGGFALGLWWPAARSTAFFAVLSCAGILYILGPADGAWLIGCGLVLIACCHLPLRMPLRVGVVVAVGLALALSRAGALPSLWSAAVWPVLGSMFMFRLVLYIRALASGQVERGWAPTISYFFMLPNLVFPLFPVVDYQTFRKTYYDKPPTEIYEQGMQWIARGLLHLLLYRFVYQYVVTDPADVERLSDLVQYMLGTFLLYLRVSGQFHLIVGLLHLFGFRLPETHHLYYLSHNFTELWRRINIYWKDFMLQVVFYPAYFRLKRLGPVAAVGWSTAIVFLATWILHSYQWFWLRGGFPLTVPDFLFWSILGGFVVLGAIREARQGAKSRRKVPGWDLRAGLSSAATFGGLCFLWSLWSTESFTEWLWLLGAATSIDLAGLGLLLAVFGLLVALGGKNWDAPPSRQAGWLAVATGARARTLATLSLLLLAGLPAVQGVSPPPVGEVLASLQDNRLNARDAALQHRGYYEQLEIRERLDGNGDAMAAKPADWQDVGSLGVIRETNDALTRDLFPDRSVIWNGNSFTTNRWGMRDQDYSLDKPPGTLRIALLGPSHVMGNGVADGEAFEALLEDRLNDQLHLPGIDRIEILNFGVDGYAMSQQVALLEDRVLRFAPDVVIATHYTQDRLMTERYLIKMLSRGASPADEETAAALASAGLARYDGVGIPLPFGPLRQAAAGAGFDVRMPSAEVTARVRRVSDEVLGIAFRRLAASSRAAGAEPAVLVLDDVLDDGATTVPQQAAIEAAALPVFNLLGVYPPERRDALRLGAWDNHPNAAGHRLIAERLYPELAEFLTRVGAPSGRVEETAATAQ